MEDEEKSELEQRLQNGIYGTPKIKPDEQRRYMGTFRERVRLTVSIAEIKQQDWTGAVRQELSAHPDCLLIINGNIDDNLTHPYLTLANSMNVSFTFKTGQDIKTNDDALALVLTDDKPVYEHPVDVAQKYPQADKGNDHQDKDRHHWFGLHF